MGLEENEKRICLNQMFIWGQLMLISVTVFFPPFFLFSAILSPPKSMTLSVYTRLSICFFLLITLKSRVQE